MCEENENECWEMMITRRDRKEERNTRKREERNDGISDNKEEGKERRMEHLEKRRNK